MLISHLNFSSLIVMQLICLFSLFSFFPSSRLSPLLPFPSNPPHFLPHPFLQKEERIIISIQKYLTQLDSRKCTQVSKNSATRKQREKYRGEQKKKKKRFTVVSMKHRLYYQLFIHYCTYCYHLLLLTCFCQLLQILNANSGSPSGSAISHSLFVVFATGKEMLQRKSCRCNLRPADAQTPCADVWTVDFQQLVLPWNHSHSSAKQRALLSNKSESVLWVTNYRPFPHYSNLCYT